MRIDPVCGKHLEDRPAHIAVEFEGMRFYVCCQLCRAEFERQPDVYARSALSAQAPDGGLSKMQKEASSFVYTVTVSRTTTT